MIAPCLVFCDKLRSAEWMLFDRVRRAGSPSPPPCLRYTMLSQVIVVHNLPFDYWHACLTSVELFPTPAN